MIDNPNDLNVEFTYVCTFCSCKVNKEKLTFTEDYELSHKDCLDEFEEHWDEREEAFDMLGW